MKRIVILLIVLVGGIFFELDVDKFGYVTIEGTKIEVIISESPDERIYGLSKYNFLPPEMGMLFIFQDEEIQTFWMKGMKFPIDIIWIRNGEIVGIEKDVPIPTTNHIPEIPSPIPVNYVLEVNAGFSDKNNFKIGDMVIINQK